MLDLWSERRSCIRKPVLDVAALEASGSHWGKSAPEILRGPKPLKVASASLPGSSGSVQPRTRPRARGLRGSAEGRPCRSVFPSAVRNFHTFRPEAFDAVLRPQNLTGEVSAGVWRGRRPSRSDLPSRGVDGRRAYLVTSGSRAKPGTIVRGRYTFGWSVRGRRMVSCTRPLAQEHIPSSLA